MSTRSPSAFLIEEETRMEDVTIPNNDQTVFDESGLPTDREIVEPERDIREPHVLRTTVVLQGSTTAFLKVSTALSEPGPALDELIDLNDGNILKAGSIYTFFNPIRDSWIVEFGVRTATTVDLLYQDRIYAVSS